MDGIGKDSITRNIMQPFNHIFILRPFPRCDKNKYVGPAAPRPGERITQIPVQTKPATELPIRSDAGCRVPQISNGLLSTSFDGRKFNTGEYIPFGEVNYHDSELIVVY